MSRTTVDVGRIVPNGDICSIMINGKPEGEVSVSNRNGKRALHIKLKGRNIVIEPTSQNGRLSLDDILHMKVAVADIWFN